jgi:hypothetical protein
VITIKLWHTSLSNKTGYRHNISTVTQSKWLQVHHNTRQRQTRLNTINGGACTYTHTLHLRWDQWHQSSGGQGGSKTKGHLRGQAQQKIVQILESGSDGYHQDRESCEYVRKHVWRQNSSSRIFLSYAMLTVLTTKNRLSKPHVQEEYMTSFMHIFSTIKVPRVVLWFSCAGTHFWEKLEPMCHTG